jgi:hypothetical protein
VNERDKGERIWLMSFIYIHEIEKKGKKKTAGNERVMKN